MSGSSSDHVRACLECLRRSWLLADLGPFIEVASDDRPGRRTPELLALDDHDLAMAMAPSRAAQMLASNRSLGPDDLIPELLTARCWAICHHDPDFPAPLRRSTDGPRCLIGRGDRDLLGKMADRGAVTIVGARRATREGLALARALGRDLAGAGIEVISGMALGIDGAVHRGALDSPGPGRTVAILGCGPDRAYPGRHRSLHAEIVSEGVVVSEMPPGTRPWRWTFPARNRVMASLGAATVVVEARSGSGSLITADLAAATGRDVGAVPGPVTSPLAEGTNALLKDGAALIRDAGDVIELLGFREEDPPHGRAPAPSDPAAAAVFEAIADGGGSVDPIAERTGMSAAEVLSALTRLELDGLVEVWPTGDVTLVPAGRIGTRRP